MKHLISLSALLVLSTLHQLSAEETPAGLERNTMVGMSDGVRLSTDIYLPTPVGQFPVLLMRTPYDKKRVREQARYFAAREYAVVVQDCRGRLASEGEFDPYLSEGRDGFDTQKWIGKQSWCNGKIGTFGGSYVGGVQWLSAPYGSQYLKAMAPMATFTSFYRNLYLGGAFRVELAASWAARTYAPSPDHFDKINLTQAYLHLPLYKMDKEFGFGFPIRRLRDWVYHSSYGPFWEKLNVENKLSQLDLPAYHIVGLHDFFLAETVKNFDMMKRLARSERARREQKLLLGPWDHGTLGKRLVGEVDFGPEPVIDINAELARWFDRQLKEKRLDREVPVRYFVMGLDRWREAQDWPPPGSRQADYYLISQGRANTRQGDGILSTEMSRSQATDTFRSDPARPIPSKGGRGVEPSYQGHWGPWDQSSIEMDPDVLVYTSPPLKAALEVAGPLTATLYLSSDAREDTDVVVKLVDVFPDGYAQNLATGILRGRFRRSDSQPELLIPGTIYEWEVDMTHVSNRFLKGHRIRLDVAGSTFPLYDRNPNTGGGPDDTGTFISTQTLHHSSIYPSRVTLPVSPDPQASESE